MNFYEDYLKDFVDAVSDTVGEGGLARRLAEGDIPSFSEVLNFLLQNLFSESASYLGLLTVFIVVILFCALIRETGGKLHEPVDMAACAVVVVSIIRSGFLSGDILYEGIENISVFVKAFIPVFAALTALSGNITMSGLYGGFSLLAMELFSDINTAVVIPMMNVIMSSGIISFVSGGEKFAAVRKGIRKVVVAVLCGLTTLMLGIMSVNGFAAKGTDTLIYKTGKFVSGSAIPGIGSTISGGFDTVTAGFLAAKSLCGTAGIIIILFASAPYVMRLLMFVSVTWVSEFCADFFSCDTLKLVFEGFKDAGTLILSSYVFELLILTFGIALIMLVGG